MTTRKELFDIFEHITDKAFEIMEGKNSDYASDEDSLANFRSSEVLNVDPRKALLIRMLDKIKRQVNYIERGELSVDSAEDDVVDLINYSVLLHALNREEDKVPSFCDTPNACHYGGCMCENLYKRQDDTELKGIDSAYDVDEGFDELKDKQVKNVKNIWYNRLNESYFITFYNDYGMSIHRDKVLNVETEEKLNLEKYKEIETEDTKYIVNNGKGTQDT